VRLRVEPARVSVQFPPERLPIQGDGDHPRALLLHGSDAALDDGDAPVHADGTKALLDAAALAPPPKVLAGELRPMVGDEVGGPAAQSLADPFPRNAVISGAEGMLANAVVPTTRRE
jgi:hypothetical protein